MWVGDQKVEANASESMRAYFLDLAVDFDRQMSLASKAREKGLDPSKEVEIAPARDVAARVEGLVGPKGIADAIRILAKTNNREKTCFEICKKILSGEFNPPEAAEADGKVKSETPAPGKEKLIEQAVRTGLALFTEGVVSAPIEGISKIRIMQNPDGSEYVGVYFAGPIRGAGGTGQAFALLLADYCRKFFGIREFRPLDGELARYVEELNLYARKTRAGQYVPTEDEVVWVVKSCPVRIDGEPTEDYEVSIHRNIPSIETNRVRSGICLVISEGICLKAAKVMKIASKNGLDWQWLENLIKVSKQEAKSVQIKPNDRFMEEIVAGRPIFSFPMRRGGFRLRYGRTRFMGILAKGIHPATMVLLDEFPVFGTQVKTERPGKGCVVTPCETIDGPIVLLDDDSVKRVNDIGEAYAIRSRVKEIISVGDMLCCYGDFSKSAHPLIPSPWVEEWFALELKEKGVEKSVEELKGISFAESSELSEKHGLPLAPRFTLAWCDLTLDELQKLHAFLKTGKLEKEWFDVKGFSLPVAPEKEILETLGAEHSVKEGRIVIDKETAFALLIPVGIMKNKDKAFEPDGKTFEKAYAEKTAVGEKSALAVVNAISPFEIRAKVGVYVGTAMGRPEKSRERKMKPPVHSLFPVGHLGGKTRNLMKAHSTLKNDYGTKDNNNDEHGRGHNAGGNGSAAEAGNGRKYGVQQNAANTAQPFYMMKEVQQHDPNASLELEIRVCTTCGKEGWKKHCDCGGITEHAFRCQKCGKLNGIKACPCGGEGVSFETQAVNLINAVDETIEKIGFKPNEVKAVQGLISANKTPEALEKGFLRAKYGVSVFRDGTCRFDATEIPCTHFTPAEIGVSIKELKALGYDKDARGKQLENDAQVIELKPQDIIVSENNLDYFSRVAKFVDDLLVYEYNLPAYYNLSKPRDLIGKQCIAIAPHTSAGIVCRIIGATQVQALLAHPYLHCACRRNADGDELALILMLDGLLNFSLEFLPETRGGKMDAPLVLTTMLDPKEVDDEVHAMDRSWNYGLEFYRATTAYANPAAAKVDTILDTLGKPEQYEGIGYTHECTLDSSIPVHSRYIELSETMQEKVEAELSLMTKIRAVDAQIAAEKIILSHFFPDLYGNLRSFTRQKFRCSECNMKYRRPPLSGKCRKCGGKLALTIHKGGIEKYLGIANEMAERFDLPDYLKQRLMLIGKEIKEIFREESDKQFSLSSYV